MMGYMMLYVYMGVDQNKEIHMPFHKLDLHLRSAPM